MPETNMIIAENAELQKQTEYARVLAERGFDYGFAVGSAFVESMRNTHYKHTGTALDELVDNSIEAGASDIHIAFGYESKSSNKPSALAVVDNGHGMVPEMIRLAAAWGGTHRQDQRTGFGRFGFGLPSASVNQARRFTIFSKTDGGSWHCVAIDLDEIRDGKHTDTSGKVHVPEVQAGNLPKWISEYMQKNDLSEAHGTVVLWEKMDRTKWSTTAGMTKNLLQHFGITYRNYVDKVNLVLDGTRVDPMDPLFTTPGFRYYDLDEDRAISMPSGAAEVASKHSGQKAKIIIRYARFPLTFFAVDKTTVAGRGNQNARWNVSSDNRGIIISRMGRQIDVIERTPWHGLEKFTNNDRYWAVEIDFPAELDEEFTIANSKQGVVMSDRIWDMLKEAGMEAAIKSLKKSVGSDQVNKRATDEVPEGGVRASERSMEESERYRRSRPEAPSVEREKRAKEAFEQHVKRTARATHRPEEQVRKEIEEDVVKHPYRVAFADHPDAPFYRVEQLGGQKVLEINQAHPFFSQIYAAPGADRFLRAGLEVLLFSIGEAELDGIGNRDKSLFYATEKRVWSERLSIALDSLERFVHETDIDDDAADLADDGAVTA